MDRPLDRLAVTGIEVRGHHGVLDFERRDGQVFVVDLVLLLDTAAAAVADDLQQTVDYGTLVGRVRHDVESDPVDLIETLAQRIADTCLAQSRVRTAEVTVHKPQAPVEGVFTDVSVTITRHSPLSPPPPTEPRSTP